MSHSLLLIGLRLFPVRMKIKPFVKAGTYFNLYLNRVTASLEVSILVNDAQQHVIIPNKMKAQKDCFEFSKKYELFVVTENCKTTYSKTSFSDKIRSTRSIYSAMFSNQLFARYHFIERNHHRINFNLKTRL